MPLQDTVWLLSVLALPTVDPHSPPLLWSGGDALLESAPPSRPGSSCVHLCCLRVIVTFLFPASWMDNLYCEHPALWLCLPSSRGHMWPWGTRSSKLLETPPQAPRYPPPCQLLLSQASRHQFPREAVQPPPRPTAWPEQRWTRSRSGGTPLNQRAVLQVGAVSQLETAPDCPHIGHLSFESLFYNMSVKWWLALHTLQRSDESVHDHR